MIAALLSWTKLPQWAMELILVLIVGCGVWFGVWFVLHERYEAGIKAQQVADAKDTQAIKDDAAKKTADLQVQANEAESAYEKEHQASLDYQQSHPDAPVRLCIATKPGRSGMSKASPTNGGNASRSAATVDLPKVSGGDSGGGTAGVGPDISRMLSALARAGDNTASVLREYQQR